MEVDCISPRSYSNKRRYLHDEYVTTEYHNEYSMIPQCINTSPTDVQSSGVWAHNLYFKSLVDPCKLVLKNLHLKLEGGSRCVLLGDNPEEKEIFLRLLAGKHMVKHGSIKISGKDAFGIGSNTVAYLNSEWLSNPLIQRDLPVGELIHCLGGDRYPDRRDLLLNILNVSQHWHMHRITTSERLRVQIVLRLLQPWHVLLIEEESLPVEQETLDLLLEVLKWETEERGAIVIYSSSRVQGLINWCTHWAHLQDGRVVEFRDRASVMNIASHQTSCQYKSPLMRLLENEIHTRTNYIERKKQCRT